jgi:hypothetical protein
MPILEIKRAAAAGSCSVRKNFADAGKFTRVVRVIQSIAQFRRGQRGSCAAERCCRSNGDTMQKSESISLRVTEDVKKAVERAARSEQLTTATFVERVLIDGLQQRGYLRPTTSAACEQGPSAE